MVDYSEQLILLVEKRTKLHLDDPGIQMIWHEMVDILIQVDLRSLTCLAKCIK